jgi:hypothetical protein
MQEKNASVEVAPKYYHRLITVFAQVFTIRLKGGAESTNRQLKYPQIP